MPRRKSKPPANAPVEIPMTDLGWAADAEQRDQPERPDHAAGTPGGGSASGGLAGSNVGHGDPDDADLVDALGSSERDMDGDETTRPAAGHAGGAVGGTPAGKRARRAHTPHGLRPGAGHPGDSTIGASPEQSQKPRRGGRS
jgi:hypothetical protein